MPKGDGTGSRGYGAMTGRAAGYCAGYSEPGFMNPYRPGCGRGREFGRGRGFGRNWGRGFGRGWRRGNYPYPGPLYGPAPNCGDPYKEPSPEEEKAYLEKVVESLENELTEAKKRIEELSQKEK
jgi:hypothetical protein